MLRLTQTNPSGQKGAALLAVLWLTIALTVMGMTTAMLVRDEAERVHNRLDSEQGYYLARGGIDAAIYALTHPVNEPANSALGEDEFHPGQRWLHFNLGGGTAEVQVMPESAKLGVNQASVEQLAALFAVLGEPLGDNRQLADAVDDWRKPEQASLASPFDLFYAGLPHPYKARHAAVEDVDELLSVKGISRDLFFGRLIESDGAWKRLPPLGDLLTTETALFGINVNYAQEEALAVQPGWDSTLAHAVVTARQVKPFASLDELVAAVPALAQLQGAAPLSLGPYPVYTLTSTAWPVDSKVRRTVRARVRVDSMLPLGFRVLAWWSDWPWSETPPTAVGEAVNGGSRT